MFTTYTYQDYLAAEDKIALLCKAIEKFKASAEFVRALSASSYFRGENPTIARKTILRTDGGTSARERKTSSATASAVASCSASSRSKTSFCSPKAFHCRRKRKNVSARISTTFSPAWANAPCCTGSATATGTPTIWKSSRWHGRRAADSSPCWPK